MNIEYYDSKSILIDGEVVDLIKRPRSSWVYVRDDGSIDYRGHDCIFAFWLNELGDIEPFDVNGRHFVFRSLIMSAKTRGDGYKLDLPFVDAMASTSIFVTSNGHDGPVWCRFENDFEQKICNISPLGRYVNLHNMSLPGDFWFVVEPESDLQDLDFEIHMTGYYLRWQLH